MKVVIFGTGNLAEVAYWYMTEDSDHEVCAFCLDGSYIEASDVLGLPVVAREDVVERYPPDEFSVYVAVGDRKLNRLRAQLCEEFRGLGYGLASYVSSRILKTGPVAIGEHCFIQHGVVCQPNSRVGDDVILWSGAHVGRASEIGDHVYVSPNAAIGGGTTIGAYSFIGLNAAVRNDINVAEGCVVGAGAYVDSDTRAGEVIRPPKSERLVVDGSELGEFR